MVAARRNHFFRTAAAVGRREQQHGAEEAYHNHKHARVPTSSKAILGLQEVRAGDARMQAECAVCLKDFDAEDKLTVMPCSHAFHQECIFGWLRVNHVCPLCRHTLPTEEEEEEEFSMPGARGLELNSAVFQST
uniref:RING-type domain-containing protein n=1 Tax=Arundo donax TaxID=35708 RepID=A0A0A9FPR0_ARUDO